MSGGKRLSCCSLCCMDYNTEIVYGNGLIGADIRAFLKRTKFPFAQTSMQPLNGAGSSIIAFNRYDPYCIAYLSLFPHNDACQSEMPRICHSTTYWLIQYSRLSLRQLDACNTSGIVESERMQ